MAPVDLLELQFPYQDNSKTYSFNGLHWGMASKVSHSAEKYRWMGNASRYTYSALLEVFKGEKVKAKVSFETKGKINMSKYNKTKILIFRREENTILR